MAKSRVWTKIDFRAQGIQSDFARVPYSSDSSAYGWLPVPMFCMSHGDGPTALFIGGTHGDEYEGQVALVKLARELSESELRGRVIILPSLNRPAAAVGLRNSPIDGGNLNRVFPGNSDGGPTEMIADYVTNTLFPMADFVIDLHAGGKSLEYLPIALARPGQTDHDTRKIRRLLNAFGAPYSVITTGAGGGANSTLYAAAETAGIPALTTELGYGGTLSGEGLGIAEQGLRRVLREYDIVQHKPSLTPTPTKMMKSLGPRASVFAPCNGLFEPYVGLGEEVSAGQLAGAIHNPERPTAAPEVLSFTADGMVAWRRFATLTETGDALFGLMKQMVPDEA